MPVSLELFGELMGEMLAIYRPNDAEESIERVIAGFNRSVRPAMGDATFTGTVEAVYRRPSDGDWVPTMPSPNEFLSLSREVSRRLAADQERALQAQSVGRLLAAPVDAETPEEAEAKHLEHRAYMKRLRDELRAKLDAAAAKAPRGHISHTLIDLGAVTGEGSPDLALGMLLMAPTTKQGRQRLAGKARPSLPAPSDLADLVADAGRE